MLTMTTLSPKRFQPTGNNRQPLVPKLKLQSIHLDNDKSIGLVRLQTDTNSAEGQSLDPPSSFRGRKARIKDIVEIRKRIKKLDFSVNLPRSTHITSPLALPVVGPNQESNKQKLSKFYDKLVGEYIRDNPQLQKEDKKLIICKPFKVRRKQPDEQIKSASIENEQATKIRLEKELEQIRKKRRKIAKKALELSEIGDYMRATNINLQKPTTALTAAVAPPRAKPIAVYGQPQSVSISPKFTRQTRLISTSIEKGVRKIKPFHLARINDKYDFRLQGWNDKQQFNQEY